MTRIKRLENDFDQVKRKLKITSELIEKEVWIRNNPPKFKYGDTFEGGYRVLSAFADKASSYSFFTEGNWNIDITNMSEAFIWRYNIDTTTGHCIISETTLIKCVKL
jgi:hypothetical protein